MTVKDIKKGAAVLAILVVSIPALLGCAPQLAHASPTDTIAISPQSATPEESDSLSATPEVKSTPTPASIPELSFEEERALLGVKNETEEIIFNRISIMCYTQKNERNEDITKYAWIFVGMDSAGNNGVYSNWSDDIKLYSISDDDGKITPAEIIKNAEYSNVRMKDSKIIAITSLFALEEFYQKMGIKKELPPEMLKILALSHEEKLKYVISMSDCMDLYIKCTPKEYRTSWKDFDETLVMSTPMPVETVVPSSFNSYRQYTSKDGASNINYPFKRITQPGVVVDENVIHGYRTPGYYGPTHTVVAVKHLDQQDQHTKTKI